MDTLRLSLPVQHDYTDPTVETDIVRLREWLEDMPLMDVVETLRLVRGGLDGLNEQKLEPDRRLELLDTYRPTTQRLMHTVDPLQLGQLNLARARRGEAIEGVGRLLLSLTGGYKLVVAGLYAASARDRPHPLLGHALYRALQQMAWVLLDGARFYREARPLLVAEIHQIYRLARRFGLLDVTLPDTGADTALTAAGYYHAGMLLALSEPARLEEGEAGQLFDVLLRHADQCRIVPGNSWEGTGEGLFLVDLNADALPVPCTRLDVPARLKDAYLLDANPALQAIRAQLAATPAGMRMQSPEAMVLRRLLPEDLDADRRSEGRHGDGRIVSLLYGLGPVHAYLSHAAGTAGDQAPPPDALRCTVLDSSAGGMKLSWESGAAGDARVGELLGVLETQGGQTQLRLAIVRSVRVPPEGGVETGVQLLVGGAGAVSCMLPDRPDSPPLSALFMPAREDEQINATLLIAKGVYEFGRRLRINVGGRTISVRAGRRVYDSPVFDRFEFTT